MTTQELLNWGTRESEEFIQPYIEQSVAYGMYNAYNGDTLSTLTRVEGVVVSGNDTLETGITDKQPHDHADYLRAPNPEQALLPSLSIYPPDIFRFLYLARANPENGVMDVSSNTRIGYMMHMGTRREIIRPTSHFNETQIRFLANMALDMQSHGLTLRVRA